MPRTLFDRIWENVAKQFLKRIERSGFGQEQVRELMRLAAGGELTVDLEQRQIGPFSFEFDAFERHCLLEGLDDIARALLHEGDIIAFEAKHPAPIGTAELPEPRA